MQCPRCSYLNRPAAKFCARCRQPLMPASPVAPPAMVACVQCRQPIPFGIQFCDQCGAQQTAVPPAPPVPVPTPSLVQPPVQSPQAAVQPASPVLPPPPDYRKSLVEIGYQSDGRFGLRVKKDGKKLTFSADGGTNNTRVWIDGDTPLYGSNGRFITKPDLNEGRLKSIWSFKGIEVTQCVSYVYGMEPGRVDTIEIKYELANTGSKSKRVGLRIMIDTLIGDNDGVPFVVPGRKGIVTETLEFRGDKVPESIQALEKPELAKPGVIVRVRLQGGEATRPDKLVITHWPGSNADWDFPLKSLGSDSAIGLYFDPQPLSPGEARTIVTYYGLGSISSTDSGNAYLSLSFDRAVEVRDKFWITALVIAPKAGQRVRLSLPEGLIFVDGCEAEQHVTPGGEYTQVSWRVSAEALLTEGRVTADLKPDGISESQTISVKPRGAIR
jgi:hypothetical protein